MATSRDRLKVTWEQLRRPTRRRA